MPLQPLTHHEILGLVEPFTRRGRHVDLAASDRLERRLVFKPIEHEGLRETLQLDNPERGRWRLVRVLTQASGLQARLEAEGSQPGELLARVEAVSLARGFASGAGWAIGFAHRIGSEGAPGGAGLVLLGASLQLDALTLEVSALPVAGAPAEIRFQEAPGAALDLPADLFAVLGRPWGLVERTTEGWRCRLQLPRREPARSAAAERDLARSAAHLRQTLAEPPGRFHERWQRARWQVTLRRATPLLIALGLIAAAPALAGLALAQNSVLRMLVFNGPPLLLVLFFGLREMPRFEIPPRPRPATVASWRRGAAEPAALNAPR